jgi:hypothetical protein
MRADEMRVGEQYEMQRGATYRKRRVTLLAKDAPSGRSHRVLVRMEEGIGAGTEKEVPSKSIHYLPGTTPPMRRATRKLAQKPSTTVHPDWMPAPGEAVSWTQTLGSRFTAIAVDAERRVVRIEGVVMGVMETYEAPVSELSPYEEPQLVLHENEVEDRLGDRLPVTLGAGGESLKPKPSRVEFIEEDEDIVDRLIFSPGCLAFYRRRFARGASIHEAGEQLRAELRKAQQLRKHHTGEYLRLRVSGRFDVVLKKRPVWGEFASSYVAGLQLPAKPTRLRKRRYSKAA